jgi:Protein of unknown function (DUF3040)
MPLSEDEQRQLDQIERDLAHEPEFAGLLAGEQRRRIILAAVLLSVGMIRLLTGVVTTQTAAMIGALIAVAAMLAIIAALAIFVVF